MERIVTSELRTAILTLAARPDIRSISCPLTDFRLWQGLFKEQVSRSNRLDLPPQEALCLMGPGSGIPGITTVFRWLGDYECPPPVTPDQEGNFAPDRWGGEVHIPYEGACGADLFILPEWHNVFPDVPSKPNGKFSWVVHKKCNFLLLDRDLGELPYSTRSELVKGWWLHKNTVPFPDCNPFHDSMHD